MRQVRAMPGCSCVISASCCHNKCMKILVSNHNMSGRRYTRTEGVEASISLGLEL